MDAKYDAAFALTALLDDENHPDNMPGQPRKFLSRAPAWRSDDVSVELDLRV